MHLQLSEHQSHSAKTTYMAFQQIATTTAVLYVSTILPRFLLWLIDIYIFCKTLKEKEMSHVYQYWLHHEVQEFTIMHNYDSTNKIIPKVFFSPDLVFISYLL